MQPGALSVVNAMIDEVDSKKVDSVFHIGDISYATGFLVEWDFFLSLIRPLASRVSYMTAIGNHERCIYSHINEPTFHFQLIFSPNIFSVSQFITRSIKIS